MSEEDSNAKIGRRKAPLTEAELTAARLLMIREFVSRKQPPESDAPEALSASADQAEPNEIDQAPPPDKAVLPLQSAPFVTSPAPETHPARLMRQEADEAEKFCCPRRNSRRCSSP